MAGLACLVLPLPRQGDLFSSSVSVSVPVSDLSWRKGRIPLSLRRAVRHELRRRDLRQDDLAHRIGISRPQLTNALCGRFGLGSVVAERLKTFVVEAAEGRI
jgi:predicted XRE-type DNA-binding protein